MTGAFRTRTGWRAFGVWAVACALALRILIAPGMMPVADAGGVRITLCTGEGPVQVTVDRDGTAHRGDHKQDKATHEACAFSSLSAASLLSDGPAYAAAEPVAPIAPAARPPLPARAPPASTLPPATGPPLLA
jgi:hypothetical protein